MRRLLAVSTLALALAACEHPVSQAEFDALASQHQALQDSYDVLRAQLQTWSGGMVTWGQNTGNAVCDIVDKNGPASKYAAATQTYCGTGDPPPNHPPDDPDDWGQD